MSIKEPYPARELTMGSFLGGVEPRAFTMTAKQVGTTFECARRQVWQDL